MDLRISYQPTFFLEARALIGMVFVLTREPLLGRSRELGLGAPRCGILGPPLGYRGGGLDWMCEAPRARGIPLGIPPPPFLHPQASPPWVPRSWRAEALPVGAS